MIDPTMLPALFAALAALVVVMPPTVDGWIEARVKSVALLGVLIMLVGVVCGAAGAALSQLATGSTWRSALTFFLVGTISGIASALKTQSSKRAAIKAAAAIALFVVFGHVVVACGGTVNPAAIPGDVVQLDADVCKLVEDLGGPQIVFVCPTKSGSTAKVSISRTQAATLHLPMPASSSR